MFHNKLLHLMIRVSDLDKSINFYTKYLGMKVLRKKDYKEGRFTLAFLGYDEETKITALELTFNWDQTTSYDLGDGFGHLAIVSSNLTQDCDRLKMAGIKFLRHPGPMKYDSKENIAFIEDPDGYKNELIEKS